MLTPSFVLRPLSSGYKQVILPMGVKSVGRSMETEIRSASVSRRHFEVAVENNLQVGEIECKIRSVARHDLSVLQVNKIPVRSEWMNLPVGSRVELRTATKALYAYVLERFDVKTHGAAAQAAATNGLPARNGSHATVTERTRAEADAVEENMIAGMQCSFCMGIFVDPTEVDCKGRHLFCLECVKQTLPTNASCPVCRMPISDTCRERIMGSKSSYPTRNRQPATGAETYQSQAITFLKESIKRAIDRRLCDYSDECEWRRRSGLEPLPPPVDRNGTGTTPARGVVSKPNGLAPASSNGAINGGSANGSRAGAGSTLASSSGVGLNLGGGGGSSSNKRAKLNPATLAPRPMTATVSEVIDISDDD